MKPEKPLDGQDITDGTIYIGNRFM